MTDTPIRSPWRRSLLVLAALVPLPLYLIIGAMAAALVMGPHWFKSPSLHTATQSQLGFEYRVATPLTEQAVSAIQALLPANVEGITVSEDRLSLSFRTRAEGDPASLMQAVHLSANRIRHESGLAALQDLEIQYLGTPVAPDAHPRVMSATDKARTILLGSLLSLPVFALLCWGFRRRLHTARDFTWKQGTRWTLLALLGIYAVNISLSALLPPQPESLQRYLDAYRPLFTDAPIWATALLMIVAAPLVEELAFRKWMLSLLPRAIGAVAGVLLGCALFISIHLPESAWHVTMLAAPSLAFSLLWMRSRSLLLCWVAHAVMNSIAFLALHQQV